MLPEMSEELSEMIKNIYWSLYKVPVIFVRFISTDFRKTPKNQVS
jgi:hypothetical protein